MEDGDYIFQLFNNLISRLESFLLKRVLVSPKTSELIAEHFLDVLSNCDTVDYDEPGVVEAYAILHFIDRYHRFQLIYRLLIAIGILPVRQLPCDILDFGTGPAPSLYALSDIYQLKKFGQINDIDRFSTLVYRLDYVESSARFRYWLHHFSEFLHSQGQHNLDLPYHTGSFWNARGLNFQELKGELQQEKLRN